MISITRSLARQLRAVFRRAGIKPHGDSGPRAHFLAGPDGLCIRTMTPDIAIEYHLPGELPVEELSLPLAFLDDCEGRQSDPVTVETSGKRILVSWRDGGIPQMANYDAAAPKNRLEFPERPETFANNEPELWQALHDAREAADRESIRYALNCIHLRGKLGQLVTTDGGQILIQGGFQLPWEEDLMIAASAILGCRDLAPQGPVQVGKTDHSIVFVIGEWTLWLEINRDGRFPAIDVVVKQVENGASVLSLPATDAEFLAQALPRLPDSEDDQHHPVTLDLNGQAMVRAKAMGEDRVTELVLSNATVSGEPVRIDTNRTFLARALKLGFSEVRITSSTAPAYCTDGRRQYIWCLLSPEGALGPSSHAVRIESPLAGAKDSPSQPKPTRRRFTMSENPTTTASASGTAPSNENTANEHAAINGHAEGNGPPRRTKVRKPGSRGNVSPIEQAVALRESLRETVTKTNELIRALKRQKQQSRLVVSTLASLKELQKAG